MINEPSIIWKLLIYHPSSYHPVNSWLEEMKPVSITVLHTVKIHYTVICLQSTHKKALHSSPIRVRYVFLLWVQYSICTHSMSCHMCADFNIIIQCFPAITWLTFPLILTKGGVYVLISRCDVCSPSMVTMPDATSDYTRPCRWFSARKT